MRDIFIFKIFRGRDEARSANENLKWCQKYYASGVRKITIFFFGRVLGGRLARGELRKNDKCLKTTKYLVVVWREESREKITSVGKRLSTWWSSRATSTWDL